MPSPLRQTDLHQSLSRWGHRRPQCCDTSTCQSLSQDQLSFNSNGEGVVSARKNVFVHIVSIALDGRSHRDNWIILSRSLARTLILPLANLFPKINSASTPMERVSTVYKTPRFHHTRWQVLSRHLDLQQGVIH
jgi:hypothetical protein